ncbi:TonB-dependent receptor [Flavobacterium sp. F-328]|uniref:TonB-dependent receptor n=1 Tax=Flavobacterium erciyesense TaxID=2825842 RepID=A0ABS5D7K3_9FLAO|nr:TonB-dependent receptor [Flavobacterium erciyesense]MBQ0909973.1 TonB-dependent receptor [Flavobacterium erciyesense]
MKNTIVISMLLLFFIGYSQNKKSVSGKITSNNQPIPGATVSLLKTTFVTQTDSLGQYFFSEIPNGNYTIQVIANGFQTKNKNVNIKDEQEIILNFALENTENQLDEVVVSGTLKPVKRLENPVPVEIISAPFLKQNPTSNVLDALQNVNGLRPQNNCNVCNTGDIRINGLDGPYTMVTIDGMPIVSALGTVYGLSGIPNAMIDKIEVVKGAASTLYGSEAVGGLINIITKKPFAVPLFTADVFTTSWLETNVDLGYKTNIGSKATALFGVNYFTYNNPIDNNNDNFTDVSLQNRGSFFSKININRASKKEFSLVSRYLYEDRWGGEMQWNKSFRGGDQVYGESIYTSRYEFLGKYELPVAEKMFFQFSVIGHDQNSVYGNATFLANQKIAFGQFIWDKNWSNHSVLFGTALRYQFYNDNTPATATANHSKIYSAFAQDEITHNEKTSTLIGLRYDYNDNHGSIFTPRFAFKFKPTPTDILRFNFGTGFRIVNLFTEDHQALSGAREVVIQSNLKPETSYNLNLNYLKKFKLTNAGVLNLELASWYTYFTNRIFANYDINPNQIIYDNLNGNSTIFGLSANADWVSPFGLKANIGTSYFDAMTTQDGISLRPLFTERYSLNWGLSYDISNWFLSFDFTGNLTGPMRLPLLSELDPRREISKPYSIQNIQMTFKKIHNLELYTGVKNLLNWTPNRGNPFLIARANDPFDSNVQVDNSGAVIPTADNPFALTFDPTYAYGPNQGRRFFIGLRYHFD